MCILLKGFVCVCVCVCVAETPQCDYAGIARSPFQGVSGDYRRFPEVSYRGTSSMYCAG